MNMSKGWCKKELFLLLLIPSSVIAETTALGRLQISGSGITHHLGSLIGDVMAPFTGSPSSFLFVDLMGDYASNATYLISPGTGLRHLFNNQILGAYFFGDYEQTSLGKNFWNLSPGIEWMTPHWDAHLNAYFPTRTHRATGAAEFASALGNERYITFTPGTHNQYDRLMTPYTVIGNGVDVEVGYSIDKNANALRSRLYIGGYYYQAPNNNDILSANPQNIAGITAGFSHALSKNWNVTVFNSYDSVSEYNAGIRVSLTFGGESNLFSDDVHTRLFDTIERHVGIIGTGAGNYDQKYWQQNGVGLEYNNIYFVSPDGTGDGTYGAPMSLTQTNLDTTAANSPNGSRFYLQGGTNAIYDVDNTSATNGTGLYVSNGQFYGRSADYQTAALSNLQPQIRVDGFNNFNGFITQGSETLFSDLTIYSSTAGYGTGIISNNMTISAETLTINNTTISQFTTAVYANNSSTGTFTINATNSHFDNNSQAGVGASAFGMNLLNTGTGDFIINTQASSFNNNTTTGDTNQAAGLSLYNASSGKVTATLNNSAFNNNSATGLNIPIAAGLYSYNNGTGLMTVNALNSQFNGNFASGQAFGLEAINNNSGTLIVNAIKSQFTNNSAAALSAGLAGGNYSSGVFIINSYHSVFIPGASNNSNGVFTYNAGTRPIDIFIY